MIVNRAEAVDKNFIAFCKARVRDGAPVQRRSLDEPIDGAGPPTGRDLLEMFESQMSSRHLDLMARVLRAQDRAYYTIGSSGHEGNAAVGRALRHTDPAFLHYRSGALMCERARKVKGVDPIRDTLLGQMASSDDPISGGRHKVWGSAALWVPPQTSTIASHLPKAVGTAIALNRANRLKLDIPIPADSIVTCTFGDASLNHSVAVGALNTCSWAAFQKLPVPILFVCEDNGIGISVHTPPGWVETSLRAKPGIRYFAADGLDLADAHRVATEAAAYVRTTRHPAALHLRVVRLLGHAGSDVESVYHTIPQIEAVEANDPLLATARLMIDAGFMDADEVLSLYEKVRAQVQRKADELAGAPKLTDRNEIVRPLAPHDAKAVQKEATRPTPKAARIKVWGDEASLPENGQPAHLAKLLNFALHDILAKYPESLLFGEDVAAKGGVYHVTNGLTKTFGLGRVFNSLLDETTILGMAIGAGHLGMLPMPEIQYLAYVHNAIDQLRGEACSTQFFSMGQFRNPMVMRVASLAYQKGFGGHFHNDNSMTALRDIPGLVIAVPSRGDDAARMLRTCMAMAKVNGRVVAFLEPIALYMTKDLHEDKDGAWQFAYPPTNEATPLGEGRVYFESAGDLTILTYGNGVYMSLRAAKELREKHGVEARVVDLRWLLPLNEAFIAEQASATGRVLVVDEGRRSGGVSEGIVTALAEKAAGVEMRRVVGADTYIPLGPAAFETLPQEADIVREAAALCATGGRASVS